MSMRDSAVFALYPNAVRTFGGVPYDAENNVVTIDETRVAEKQAELEIQYQLDVLRSERNLKLAETDWWVLPDRTPTQSQLDYRQSLRDITNTYTSLDDVVWPEKPL